MNVKHVQILLFALVLSACGNSTKDSKGNLINESSSDVTKPALPPKADSSGSISDTSMGNLSDRLEIKNGSVVDSKKHVIVNAANKWLAPGGALSGAIFRAANVQKVLEEIAAKHNGVSNESMSGTPLLETSKVFTTGAHDLSDQGTNYIIHALGPDFREAPYSANLEAGYAALRTTYTNLYSEMNRLNQQHNVTKMGVIPISAGVFAGKASQNKLYEIMIQETLSAMQRYSYLQPELYLFGASEYETVKKMLPAVISKFSQLTGLSSGVGTSSAKLALMDSPIYVDNLGSLNIQGAAASWGGMRVMCNTVNGMKSQLMQLSVGKMQNAYFLGSELEAGYTLGEWTSYSLKATAVARVTDTVKLSSGLGYMCEHMNAYFSNNIRQFLSDFGIDSTVLKRQGIVGDLSAQYHFQGAADISFTANIGIRATYLGAAEINPFAQLSCQLSELGISAIISKADAGLSFDLKY